MCCVTQNCLLIVAHSALISSTLVMVGTTGEGITTARWHLGDTIARLKAFHLALGKLNLVDASRP